MTARVLIPFLFLLASTVAAQSMFVSDELVITLRTGPSTQNAIVRNLRSGDSMTVLEADAGDGYTRVRIEDGTEGWVLSRYLSGQASVRNQLATAQRNLTEARERAADLGDQVTALSGELQQTADRLEDTESTNSEIGAELVEIRTASADALTLRDQNESLRRRLNERDEELAELTFETRSLRSSAVREWFVVGAGVLLGGIVLGLVLPTLRRKRRSEW